MAMKESGIEWVGLIPDTWSVIPNKYVMHKEKNLCEKWAGEDVMSLTMNGVIVRDLQNPTGKMPATFDGYQYIEGGDLLMCLFDIDVTPRCVGKVTHDGVTSPAYSNFKVHDNASRDYFYYYYLMVDNTKELLHLAKNLRHSFTEEQLGQLKVPMPPLSEQQAIADYLDKTCSKIDEIIAEAKASIDEYKELKQSVIFEAVTKGVNRNVKLKTSGNEWIGMMPSNKRLTKVKYCGNFKKGPFGSAITKNMFVEKGANTFKVYEQKNAIYSNCTLGYYYISKDKYEELQGFAIQPRDIIVSCAGTIGKTYVLPDNCEPGIINQALMRIRLYDKIDRTYFSYLFESLLEYAGKKYSNGSAIKNIPPFAILNNLWIVDFDVNEQIEISEYLNIKLPQIDSLITEKESLINDLESYKKSLIYAVVTGKRRVV